MLSLLYNIKKHKEMSITIADSTNDIVVSFLNDKGVSNIETLTIPATGEYGEHILSVPATAAASQGDFCVLYSKKTNKSVGVWLDIDANGTPPTSLVYSSTDYQVEVNIVTGGTAIQNAAALVLALAAETNFTDVTVDDNLDGTITFTQDVVGDTTEKFGYANSGNTGSGSFLVTITEVGLAGITQGDYVVLSNTAGDTLAVWFDVDEDGTEPTGAAYGAADGTLLIPISTGDDSTTNATNVFGLLDADAWSDSMVLTDNLNGTIKVATAIGVAPTAADPNNADDSTVGSITIAATQVGSDATVRMIDAMPKDGLRVIENFRDNEIYLISASGSVNSPKGNGYLIIKFTDVVSPVTASVSALFTQLRTWIGDDSLLNGDQKTQIVDANGLSTEILYKDSYFKLTRPANTTVYSDGDAILDVVGISTQKFTGVAKAAGRGVNFVNLLAFTTDTGLAGKTIKAVFYTASPTSPIADNAAFSYGTANELTRKGTVDLVFGTGINAGTAQLGVDSNGMINLALCPVATDIYIQVWLPVGYTPSANSTYILFKASVIQN